MAPERFSLKGWLRRALVRRTRKPSEKSTPKPVTAAEHREQPTLLNIPAELRNQIYELVLLEEKDITITPALREPGLIQACRQTRTEARMIWCLRNQFEITIYNTDPTLLHAFRRQRPHLPKGVLCKLDFQSRRDWSNLMQWCAGVHKAQVAHLQWKPESSALVTVVTAALSIAKEMQGLPWEKCEQALVSYRRTAGLVDRRWLMNSSS